ncbi:MAG: cytidine deaminase [Anaerococcus hydrogenalis]|uniref:cytidine deaminase n=1 Tax=Anaerococcus hydrogenalis TaxID=33029 RepID=UPI0028FE7F6B|nr:cytidine deaminase [Anaerococcus hydrogenalis]MDU3199493.1 cytidine deaminase [Anaerococcus hydrogenalis]MDU3687759.1 cytidine deaminase [Anaerococcus hydrogenalis]
MRKKLEELIELAIENKKNSYSPYSKFRVSSIVLTKKGNIYKGVNIENAAYSVTICAERSALSSAISAGEKEIDTIIITGDSKMTYPCGVCRQFMAEFLDNDSKIVIANSVEDYKIYGLKDILPYNFSKKDLEEK